MPAYIVRRSAATRARAGTPPCRRAYKPPLVYGVDTHFLTPETTPTLFQFPKDMARVDAEVNRLNNQVLVRYFEDEWRQVIR